MRIWMLLPLLLLGGCKIEKDTDTIIRQTIRETKKGYCTRLVIKDEGVELAAYILVCVPKEREDE